MAKKVGDLFRKIPKNEGLIKATCDAARYDEKRKHLSLDKGYFEKNANGWKASGGGVDIHPTERADGDIPSEMSAIIAEVAACSSGGLQQEICPDASLYVENVAMNVHRERLAESLGLSQHQTPHFKAHGLTLTVSGLRKGEHRVGTSDPHTDVGNGVGPVAISSCPILIREFHESDQQYLKEKFGLTGLDDAM